VSDGVDTAREKTAAEMISQPILNLMNEWHVMTTSEKIFNTFDTLRRKGEFIGNHTVYGYIIKDKNLAVDPEVAPVVRKIFDMKISGMSNQGIAEYLNSDGVLSPFEYKLQRDGHAPRTDWRKGDKAKWSSQIVHRILENPVYTGTLVQGKTCGSYKDKRRQPKDPSEWVVFENSHEPIVSETVFQIVESLLGLDTYTRNAEVYLFAGIAVCGNCGNTLYHQKANYQNNPKTYYICRNKECNQRRNIRADMLENMVLQTLKAHLKLVTDGELLPKGLDEVSFAETDTVVSELQKYIGTAETTREKLKKEIEKGNITQCEFDDMDTFYSAKIARFEKQIADILGKKKKIATRMDDVVARFNAYAEMTELTREILVTFIGKVVVEGAKDINIFFRYADFLKAGGGNNGS
jgi:hypothetical protein